ncbi:MAG: hypothetical protein HYS06_00750 [Methylocystis sp.]|nr:hypothetical protein [Methylocystis sp.]
MKATLFLVCAVLFGVTTSFPSEAQDTEAKTLKAMNNLHSEMLVCIAYYSIVKQCLAKRDPRDPLSDETEKVIDHLTSFSTKIGKSIGMTEDAMLSRLKIQIDLQMSLIQNNCVNISSLLSRHGEQCKQVVENGDSVLLEYMKR